MVDNIDRGGTPWEWNGLEGVSKYKRCEVTLIIHWIGHKSRLFTNKINIPPKLLSWDVK